MSEPFVCSNCGSPCPGDDRMGSVSHYLACPCADSYVWYDDGRGGYPVYRGDARPVPLSQYRRGR